MKHLSYLFFSFLLRTLLALGCHVAQINVHAEDDLKKIKLPKEYGIFLPVLHGKDPPTACLLKSVTSYFMMQFYLLHHPSYDLVLSSSCRVDLSAAT